MKKYKNMVTYFNESDLVKFGNFLLSDERKEMILRNPLTQSAPLDVTEKRLKTVSHADIENFKSKARN